MMNVSVNGKPQEVPEGGSVEELLTILELNPTRIAIEHNRLILGRDKWPSTLVQEGDSFEIVHFVGGG